MLAGLSTEVAVVAGPVNGRANQAGPVNGKGALGRFSRRRGRSWPARSTGGLSWLALSTGCGLRWPGLREAVLAGPVNGEGGLGRSWPARSKERMLLAGSVNAALLAGTVRRDRGWLGDRRAVLAGTVNRMASWPVRSTEELEDCDGSRMYEP